MDYTQNKEVMDILMNLSKEVEGLTYSLNSKWINNEEVITKRKDSLNSCIDKLLVSINKK